MRQHGSVAHEQGTSTIFVWKVFTFATYLPIATARCPFSSFSLRGASEKQRQHGMVPGSRFPFTRTAGTKGN